MALNNGSSAAASQSEMSGTPSNKKFWRSLINAEQKDFWKSPDKPIHLYIITDCPEDGEDIMLWGCRLGEELVRQIRAGGVGGVSRTHVRFHPLFFTAIFKTADDDGQLAHKAYEKQKVALFGPDYSTRVKDDRKVFRGVVTRTQPAGIKNYIELGALCSRSIDRPEVDEGEEEGRFWISRVRLLAKDERDVALAILWGEQYGEYVEDAEDENADASDDDDEDR